MITENLSTLKIHKLTKAQYDRELEAGRIDPNALYLTPDEIVQNEKEVYVQNDEPTDAPEGAIWVDLDDEGVASAHESLDIINMYVCSDGEYTEDGSPIIAEPDEETTYLVPQDNDGIIYASWVYSNCIWQFVEMLTVSLDEADPRIGNDGLSAYEVAVKNGFEGTEQEWLESLKGEPGNDGCGIEEITTETLTTSGAYNSIKVYMSDGRIRSLSIRNGQDGKSPVKGTDYFTPTEIQEIAEQAAEMVDAPSQGIQPDWNQNNPNVPDYIKNRPFGTNYKWEPVGEKQTIQFTYDSTNGVWTGVRDSITAPLFDAYGEYLDRAVCKMVINGDEYIGVLHCDENQNRYFGNPTLIGKHPHMQGYVTTMSNTSDDFVVVRCCAIDEGIVLKNAAPSCEVSMYISLEEEVEKIDPKYLPDPEPYRVLLWENPHPEEEFEAQNISLPNLSEYDGVEIVYGKTNTTASNEYYSSLDTSEWGARKTTGFIPLNNSVALEQTYIMGSYEEEKYHGIVRRYAHFSTEGEISISSTFFTTHGSADEPLANGVCVPFYIYGIKSGQVVSGGSSKPAPYIIRPVESEIDREWGADTVCITMNIDEALNAYFEGRSVRLKMPDIAGYFDVTGVTEYGATDFRMYIPGIRSVYEYYDKAAWIFTNTGNYVPTW